MFCWRPVNGKPYQNSRIRFIDRHVLRVVQTTPRDYFNLGVHQHYFQRQLSKPLQRALGLTLNWQCLRWHNQYSDIDWQVDLSAKWQGCWLPGWYGLLRQGNMAITYRDTRGADLLTCNIQSIHTLTESLSVTVTQSLSHSFAHTHIYSL